MLRRNAWKTVQVKRQQEESRKAREKRKEAKKAQEEKEKEDKRAKKEAEDLYTKVQSEPEFIAHLKRKNVDVRKYNFVSQKN